MPKHRAEQRTSVPPRVFLLATATVSLVLIGAFLTLWLTGPAPSAASEAIQGSGKPAAVDPVPGLKRIIFYGHSMPAGGGASSVSLGYATLAAQETGLRLANRSEGGTSAMAAAHAMESYPPARPRDAVVIHTGMNDIFRRGDDAVVEGRVGIERLLSGTANAGRRILVLECQPASWFDTPPHKDLQSAYDAWNAMLRDEASVWPNVDLLDTCEQWDPLKYTDPPKYHPNDDGHALIAGQINALLRQP